MQRSLRRAALAAAILGATFGCTRSMVQQNNKQPPDPLLVSKKPVEGKPTSNTAPRDMARVDPQPPAFPMYDGTMNAASPDGPARLSSELVVRPNR
jgi:hypothetical protein